MIQIPIETELRRSLYGTKENAALHDLRIAKLSRFDAKVPYWWERGIRASEGFMKLQYSRQLSIHDLTGFTCKQHSVKHGFIELSTGILAKLCLELELRTTSILAQILLVSLEFN